MATIVLKSVSTENIPKNEKGGEKQVRSSDEPVLEVLFEILDEIKKMNVQLAIITNTELGH